LSTGPDPGRLCLFMKTFNDPEAFARVRRFPTLVFDVATRIRDEARARGIEVIDFSIGNPNSGAPAAVVEALTIAAADNRNHQYQDPRGIPDLRAAAARWWSRRRGVVVDPEREVLVTAGSKEGIAHACLSFLSEGDALLVPTPSHPIHAVGAILAGGSTIPVPVGPGADFLESLFQASTRAEVRPRGLVVNFPGNPTGAMATPEMLHKIVRFAEARDLFIISDFANGDFSYGAEAPAMLQVPGAKERTLEFMSLARSYSMPGWRVGFAAGNPALIAAAARVKSYLDHGLFGAIQRAAVVALDGCDGDVAAARETYRRRRDAVCRHFSAAGWAIPAPDAGIYAWAPLPESFRSLGSLEFARRLVEQAGVAVIPGVGFGAAGEGYARIAFIEDEPRIQQAAERIERFLKSGPGQSVGSHPPPATGSH
jgi:alanine-synthesizing transaminase